MVDFQKLPILFEDNNNATIVEKVKCNIDITKLDWNFGEDKWDYKRHILVKKIKAILKKSLAWSSIL